MLPIVAVAQTPRLRGNLHGQGGPVTLQKDKKSQALQGGMGVWGASTFSILTLIFLFIILEK